MPRTTIAHRIVGWALHHRVTVFMLFLALVILGVVAYVKIPLQFMPSGYRPPFMGVHVLYPRANAYEVDEKIAEPLVRQFRTIRGLKEVNSNASENGVFFFLEFKDGTDMDAAYMEVRNLLERVRPDLPAGVERYRIWKFNPDDNPMMWIMVSYPPDVKSPYHLIEKTLQGSIARIPGVGRVDIRGLAEPIVRIELHQDAVERHHIPLMDLMRRLRTENFSLVSGHIDEGDRRYYIRSTARWRSIEELANLQITRTGLRLKDIADVSIGAPERTSYLFVNDREGVTLEVYKESQASSVELSRKIRRWLQQLPEVHPELRDWKIEVLFDEGAMIEKSIRDLQMAGLYGGLLAALILWFFLRDMRMTVAVALAIPMSLTMTLIVMYFSHETLNLISMLGLMLAIGLVVDNAVVVVESVDRYRQMGLEPRAAAFRGATEVGLAILTATGTTLVVFLPLILLQEDRGFAFYMGRLGFPVCVALVASLVVALVFIPVGSMYMKPRTHARNRIVEWVRRMYARGMRWMLASPFSRTVAFILVVLLFVSMTYPMARITRTGRTEGNIGDFRIIVELPPNYSLEQSKNTVLQVVRVLLDRKEELYIKHIVSRIHGGWCVVRVFLKDKDERPLKREEIIERTRAILPEIPGVQFRFGWMDTGGGRTLRVSVYGKDIQRLERIITELLPRLERIPGVIGAETLSELRTREVHLQMQDWVGQRLGVHPLLMAQVLAFAVRGITLWSAFPYQDDYINMQIMYRKSDRADLSRLLDFKVPTAQGRALPVRTLARLQFHQGIGQIRRDNGRISLPITLNLTSDADMMRVYFGIRRVMDAYPWPKEYGWRMGSSWRTFQSSQRSQTFAISVAIVMVFLLMGTLFESVVLPFCVLFSIPFAFVGVYWFLYLTHTVFDLMAGIGLIILIGIVVNNAIVLIDRVNQLRQEGYSLTDALVEGGQQRFRPIWMTALTTIFGMAPMALGKGDIVGISYAPLARAVIGGLFVSTFVTLVIVPLMYFFAVHWQQRMVALFARLRHPRAVPAVRSEP